MTLPELLACMERLDIRLTARCGKLRVDTPPGVITLTCAPTLCTTKPPARPPRGSHAHRDGTRPAVAQSIQGRPAGCCCPR